MRVLLWVLVFLVVLMATEPRTFHGERHELPIILGATRDSAVIPKP
jgi:hypothetical protein